MSIATTRKEWLKVIDYCRALDVEEGDSADYQYSVRHSTGVVTLWTRRGWQEDYYVGRFVPDKYSDKRRKNITIQVEQGSASADDAWSDEKLEKLVTGILDYVKGQTNED